MSGRVRCLRMLSKAPHNRLPSQWQGRSWGEFYDVRAKLLSGRNPSAALVRQFSHSRGPSNLPGAPLASTPRNPYRRTYAQQQRFAGHFLLAWSMAGKWMVRNVAWIGGRALYFKFLKSHPKWKDRQTLFLGFVWRGRWVFVAIAVLGGAFILTHVKEVPISGRKRLLWLNPAGVRELGTVSLEVLRESFKDSMVSPSDPRHKRVSRVVSHLVKTLRSMPELAEAEKALDLVWEVHVVDTEEFNAFVLPNGAIFVHTGFLTIVDSYDQSDDTLAAMLGHEMSHALLQHTAERASRGPLVSFVDFVVLTSLWFLLPFGLELAPSHYTSSPTVTESLVATLLELPNSRTCEHEADMVGMRIAASACYDPRKGVAFWPYLDKIGVAQTGPSFLSTHPPSEQRAANLAADSEQTLALYRTSSACAELRQMSQAAAGQPTAQSAGAGGGLRELFTRIAVPWQRWLQG